eukprot:2246195-Prymnesium_polylepis.1
MKRSLTTELSAAGSSGERRQKRRARAAPCPPCTSRPHRTAPCPAPFSQHTFAYARVGSNRRKPAILRTV